MYNLFFFWKKTPLVRAVPAVVVRVAPPRLEDAAAVVALELVRLAPVPHTLKGKTYFINLNLNFHQKNGSRHPLSSDPSAQSLLPLQTESLETHSPFAHVAWNFFIKKIIYLKQIGGKLTCLSWPAPLRRSRRRHHLRTVSWEIWIIFFLR